MNNGMKKIATIAVPLMALAAAGCGADAAAGDTPAVDASAGADGGSDAGNAGTDVGGTDAGSGVDAGSATDGGGGGGAVDVPSAGSDASAATDSGAEAPDAADGCGQCKTGQTCVAGKCIGEADCDGKCAANQICSDGQCIEVPEPCGGPCAKGQVCDITAADGKGLCIVPTCTLPTTWTTDLQKVAMMSILASDKGCDLDDDGVSNNSLGAIAELVGKSFEDTFKGGSVIMVLEAADWKTDGSAFDINVLQGELDAVNADCDLVTSSCIYKITPTSYDLATPGSGVCTPVSVFADAKINKGILTAGGPKQDFQMVLGLAGIGFKVKVSAATLSAEVSDEKGWKTMTNGRLCGVVLKKDLEAAIDKVPDAELQPVGGKAVVKSLLNTLVVPDIDTDGDSVNDGISAALTVTGIGAQISGLVATP